MPYEVEAQGRVVLVRCTGQVTAAEIEAMTTALAARADFEDQRFHVFDWSQATLPPLTEELIWATAGIIGAAATNRRLESVFVPDTPQLRAFVEYLQPTLGALKINFMPSAADAWEWIQGRTTTVRTLG